MYWLITKNWSVNSNYNDVNDIIVIISNYNKNNNYNQNDNDNNKNKEYFETAVILEPGELRWIIPWDRIWYGVLTPSQVQDINSRY